MTPDREMDRLIATEVFGWRFEDFYNGGGFWHTLPRCKRQRKDCDCPAVHANTLPAFSTNPADSKLLRDKLAETWDWTLFSPFGRVLQYSFGVWPKGQVLGQFTHIGHGDTEESAVIDAVGKWLKSKGIEVPCGEDR